MIPEVVAVDPVQVYSTGGVQVAKNNMQMNRTYFQDTVYPIRCKWKPKRVLVIHSENLPA